MVTKFIETKPQPHLRIPEMPGTDDEFALEEILPLKLVRQHTKTDDIPHVTDIQLELYRQAAFEACTEYTGLLWDKSITIRQPVATPAHPRRFRRVVPFRLDHPTIDGVVYLYGGWLMQAEKVIVRPGTRDIRLPVLQEALDVSNCCRCDGPGLGENYQIMAMYRTGFANPKAVPAGIKLGCLKFIAWAIENPGDMVMTVKNRTTAGEAGIVGTNNGSWASGAIEDWRVYVKDAI